MSVPKELEFQLALLTAFDGFADAGRAMFRCTDLGKIPTLTQCKALLDTWEILQTLLEPYLAIEYSDPGARKAQDDMRQWLTGAKRDFGPALAMAKETLKKK